MELTRATRRSKLQHTNNREIPNPKIQIPSKHVSAQPKCRSATTGSLLARFDNIVARAGRSILGAVVLWQVTPGSKHRARKYRCHQFSIAASLVPFLFEVEMEDPAWNIGSSDCSGPFNARGFSHSWRYRRSRANS